VFNIKINIIGDNAHQTNHPVIYVCNHVSYLDVVILGSFIDGCFVAKNEVATWPGFGFLAKLQKTIFISRNKSAVLQSREAIAAAMKKNYDVILFPEGTSTDGWNVMKFKAGLLSIFFNNNSDINCDFKVISNALVQPIAIHHIRTNGIDVTKDRQDLRDTYAWYGDMELVPHLWRLAKTKRTDVDVHMIDPLSPNDFVHPHDIANAAQDRVSKVIKAESSSL
jgi:1-acyl-sn-glycerol-3-phosphate acyltransferase